MPAELAVAIPTRNSAATIADCIRSAHDQDLDVALVVVDGGSSDDTCAIARSLGADVIDARLPLLEARYRGVAATSAAAVLLLDSDQVVEPGALRRTLEALAQHDVVVLGEASIEAGGLVSRLFASDKRYLHAAMHHDDPISGTLLPRAFRRETLLLAFAEIPPRVRMLAGGYDHAILGAGAARHAASIGFVPNALRHREIRSMRELWRKNFRWGRGLADLFAEHPQYRALAGAKTRGRMRRGRASRRDFAASLALMALKLPAYAAGYAYGAIARRARGRERATPKPA
jgi:glycosyltransferase involved in cell wall biosynthesis